MPNRSKDPPIALDPLSLALGSRVTRLREAAGMSAQQLAAAAGMDSNYLWRIEAGRQNLSLRNVARLARALDLTLSGLFDGVEVGDVDLESRPYARREVKGGVE